MRSLLAALAGFVAVLALLVALPIGWVATHVADEDGYVGFTASLVEDDDLRADMLAVVADGVVAQSGISDTFAPAVQQALTTATDDVVTTSAFDSAWRETMRRSHQATFGDPRDLAPEQDAADRLVIDLGPVAQVVVDGVTSELPVGIEAPQQLLVPVGGSNERQLIERVNQTPEQLRLTAGAAAVMAGLALLLARRRSGAIAWLGLGALLVAGLLHWVGSQAVPRAIEQSSSSGLAARAQTLLADAAVDSLDRWLLVTAIAGGAAVLLGVVGQAMRSRRYED